MPSAYLLARDQIEQARAILTNEVWFDPELDNLFQLVQFRLTELERAVDIEAGPQAPARLATPPRKPRTRLMPWLDP